MKVKHIIILVAMAAGIAILLGTYGDAGTQGDFAEAAKHPNKEIRVKTNLIKEKGVEYNPELDAEKFIFYAQDLAGEVRKVTCYSEKPYDFERSEEVVILGKVRGNDEFIASSVQIKCPSKYESEVSDI